MQKKPTYEELKEANDLLKKKVEWLEGVYHSQRDAGSQVRSRFLSNISHEIRTPMNAILGFSNLLKSSKLTETEREEYIGYISHNSNDLLKVMDNIIDMSLLETQNLQLKAEEVLVEDLFQEIFNHYNSREVRSMNYRVAFLMTTPSIKGRVVVKADGHRLYRILDNLVEAAMLNQTKGVIEMKMDITEDNMVHFSIISGRTELLAERAKMIFEKNGSTDDWHNHLDKTGMAYKLSRDLVFAMEGNVSLKQINGSKLGVVVELPIAEIGALSNSENANKEDLLLN